VHPVLSMALVLAVLGAVLGGLHLLQRRITLHPELARKLVHVAMGLITLTFPWVFASPWPVLALALLAAAALLLLRFVPWLRQSVGGVLHGVERDSGGELYFPLAVAAVFYLADGVAVLYVIPILLLTLADATAALIGVRYGMVKFDTFDGGRKSLEGAVAFFTVAFLCTHVTLLLVSHVGRVETLLIGIEIGFLVMLVELVAWRGLDNLFIPLFSFALLYNIEYLQIHELANHLWVLALLAGFIALWRTSTTLDFGALVSTMLIAYVMWSVGGLQWLVPPVACFASYALLWPEDRLRRGRMHDLRAVLSFSAVGLFWLFVSTRFPVPDWSYLGTVAFAAQLAVIGCAAGDLDGRAPNLRRLAGVCFVGWFVPFIPWVLLQGIDAGTLRLAAAALPPVAVGLACFAAGWRQVRASPYGMERWVLQSSASALASLAAILPWVWIRP
jgi:phytol kinase